MARTRQRLHEPYTPPPMRPPSIIGIALALEACLRSKTGVVLKTRGKLRLSAPAKKVRAGKEKGGSRISRHRASTVQQQKTLIG